MESGIKDLFCTYINIHYIICDCGDTFPTEEELKEHLQTKHNGGKILECVNVPPIIITNNADVRSQQNSAPKICDKSGLDILLDGVVKIMKTNSKPVIRPVKVNKKESKKKNKPTDKVDSKETLKMILNDKKDSVIEILSHLLGKDFLPPPRPTKRLRPFEDIDKTIIAISNMTFKQAVMELKKRKDKLGYKEAKYHCQYCYKYYNSEQKFREHMVCHDESSGPIVCSVCKVRVKSQRLLDRHSGATHSKLFSCKMCHFTSTYRSTAVSHVAFHKGEKYKCPHCPREFSFLTTRETHIRSRHPARHACPLCGYTFITQHGLKTHTYKTHKFDGETPLNGPYCAECEMQFLSQEAHDRHLEMSSVHNTALILQRPNTIKSTNTCPREKRRILKIYNCEECGMELTHLNYMRHFRLAHEGKSSKLFPRHRTMQCQVCGKVCVSSAALYNHKLIHGAPRHRCEHCGRMFVQRANLKLHLATHLPREQRPTYQCNLCDTTFTMWYNLKRHLAVKHTGLKEFPCDICGKNFTSKSVLQGHVNHVHLKIARPPRAPRGQRRIFNYVMPDTTIRGRDQDDHELRNAEKEISGPDHEAMRPDHEVMSPGHEVMGPDHVVMGPDHEVMGPDHVVMGPDYEVMGPDHEVIVPHQDMNPDYEIRSTNRTEIRRLDKARYPDSKIRGPNRKTKSNDHEMRGLDHENRGPDRENRGPNHGHRPRSSKRRSDHDDKKSFHSKSKRRGEERREGASHEIQGLIIKSSDSNAIGSYNEIQSVLVKSFNSFHTKKGRDHERTTHRAPKERPHPIVRSTMEPRRPQHIQMRDSGHIDLSAYDHIDMLD